MIGIEGPFLKANTCNWTFGQWSRVSPEQKQSPLGTKECTGMGYRISFLRDDRTMGNIAAEKPLRETLEDAVELMPLFKADHALVLDDVGHLVERIKCSAYCRMRLWEPGCLDVLGKARFRMSAIGAERTLKQR